MNSPQIQSLTPKMHGIDDHVPHQVTNDELYRRSSQYRFWSFTRDELYDLRVKANLKGLNVFKQRVSQLDESQAHIKQFVSDSFDPLTVSEEHEIVVYFARKCFELSNFFKFTSQVRLTSINYLLKFYLVHSVIEFPPQSIMYTCLFLAAKSENNFIGINNFAKALPKTTPESILENEYLILDTMRFTLMVHHPLRPLYGFYLDIQSMLVKLDFNRLCKDYETSKKIINDSIFTDTQFHFTPPQIALAALYIADDIVCMRYLMRKFGVKRKQMLQKMNEHEDGTTHETTTNADLNESTATPAPQSSNEANKSNTPNDDNDDGNGSGDENSIKSKKKELSPLEQYEQVISVVKECAEIMKEKIDPSVEEAKRVSLRVHFCHDPVKYFPKLVRSISSSGKNGLSNSINSDNVAYLDKSVSSTPVSEQVIPMKRPDDDNFEAVDTKKLKTV